MIRLQFLIFVFLFTEVDRIIYLELSLTGYVFHEYYIRLEELLIRPRREKICLRGFAIHFLKSIIYKLATCEVSIFYLVSVA